MSARWGGGVCCKSCGAFVQPAFFLAGNRVKNGVAWRGQRRRIQILAIDALHNSDFRLPV